MSNSFNCPYCEANLEEPDENHLDGRNYVTVCESCNMEFVFNRARITHYFIDKYDGRVIYHQI